MGGLHPTMRIRRWTAAAALGAVLVFSAPAAASATTECTPPGGLLGLSVDDCGINASLLGVDVSVGGSTSGSGDETPDEPTPPDESPADDPGTGGSSGGGESTSDPAPPVPSPAGPADVPDRSTSSLGARNPGSGTALGGGSATGSPGGWTEAGVPDGDAGRVELESITGSAGAGPTTDPTGAAGPGSSGNPEPGQLRGPLSEIPAGAQAVGPLARGQVAAVALALVTAGVIAAVTGISLAVRKHVMRSAS